MRLSVLLGLWRRLAARLLRRLVRAGLGLTPLRLPEATLRTLVPTVLIPLSLVRFAAGEAGMLVLATLMAGRLLVLKARPCAVSAAGTFARPVSLRRPRYTECTCVRAVA